MVKGSHRPIAETVQYRDVVTIQTMV